MEFEKIHICTKINAPIATVWHLYTAPEHIVNWNAASADWHTTKATNDLRVGGKTYARMEAKDGSFGFDFEGEYSAVEPLEKLVYRLEDGRIVHIDFEMHDQHTQLNMMFDAEDDNNLDMQKAGWQAILNNFKTYCEGVV